MMEGIQSKGPKTRRNAKGTVWFLRDTTEYKSPFPSISLIEAEQNRTNIATPEAEVEVETVTMQPTPGSESNSGGGGGLPRFRSTPATLLETLLLKEEEEDEGEDLLGLNNSTNQGFTHLLSGDPVGFFRQNSSPAEFLGNSVFNSQQYISKYDYDYDYASASASPDNANANPIPQEVEEDGEVSVKVEKILEESVPCRVRAKRGCATHPRSIAERVRRTRISDRIRKLQELVPNMDKQTNTADMLDEAVAYVKFLQKQIEELSEQQRRCKCVVQR